MCPLWPRTVDALRAWIQIRGDHPGPLLLNRLGQRLTRSGLAWILRKYASRLASPPRHTSRVTPHVIRHTFAVHYLNNGGSLTRLQQLLGHAHMSTTLLYLRYAAIPLKEVPTPLDHLAGLVPNG